jgi:hypothetical protein
MRTALFITLACLVLPGGLATAAAPPSPGVVLQSGRFSPGIVLGESKDPIHSVRLEVDVDAQGEGFGSLVLDPNPPQYDEYGDPVNGWEHDPVEPKGKPLPVVSLACTVKFVKAGHVGRTNERPVKRNIFRIEGPKITSRLFVATRGPGLAAGRLLVHDKEGRVQHVVELHDWKKQQEVPAVPCHPGCFPAGTRVLVPGGSEPIERIKIGDVVTTVGADGRAGSKPVEHVFRTTNKLVDVRTDRGSAVTTEAQPFCLADGAFRKAGELKAGDRVLRWGDGRREEAVVREVAPTGREERVFNLILGEGMFVAGDFLVRGKPPAGAPAAPAPAGGRPLTGGHSGK